MVSCLMGDSTALASAIVRCCPKEENTETGLLQNNTAVRFSIFLFIPSQSPA